MNLLIGNDGNIAVPAATDVTLSVGDTVGKTLAFTELTKDFFFSSAALLQHKYPIRFSLCVHSNPLLHEGDEGEHGPPLITKIR